MKIHRPCCGRAFFLLTVLTLTLMSSVAWAVEVPPTYVNYVPPEGLGTQAGEPSLGVNERTGAVMFIADTQTLKATFDQCTSLAAAAWSVQSFPTTSQITLDPILFTDQAIGPTF